MGQVQALEVPYDVANGWILTLKDGRCASLDSSAMIGSSIPTAGEGVDRSHGDDDRWIYCTSLGGQMDAQRRRAGLRASHMLHYGQLHRRRLMRVKQGAQPLRSEIGANDFARNWQERADHHGCGGRGEGNLERLQAYQTRYAGDLRASGRQHQGVDATRTQRGQK